MSQSAELGNFLKAMRSRLTPEQVTYMADRIDALAPDMVAVQEIGDRSALTDLGA